MTKTADHPAASLAAHIEAAQDQVALNIARARIYLIEADTANTDREICENIDAHLSSAAEAINRARDFTRVIRRD